MVLLVDGDHVVDRGDGNRPSGNGHPVLSVPCGGQLDIKRGQGAENQADLGSRLPLLDRYQPLAADGCLLCERSLGQAELAASIANDETEVQGCAYPHGIVSCLRTTTL